MSSANMLNRRSYNNLPHQSIKEESDDGSEQHYQESPSKVENQARVSELEEEVKFLKILLQVSYEYMTKMLAEELGPGVKGELQKVLHLI